MPISCEGNSLAEFWNFYVIIVEDCFLESMLSIPIVDRFKTCVNWMSREATPAVAGRIINVVGCRSWFPLNYLNVKKCPSFDIPPERANVKMCN